MRIQSRIAAMALLLIAGRLAIADDDAQRDALIGTPSQVTIGPENPPLVGLRATRQLIVTATYPDGSIRDLTRALTWTSLDPEVATVSRTGQVIPKRNGTATIVARRGSIDVTAKINVERTEATPPVSFQRDVIPALSQAGCNTGACHGTPTGKGGFRLSLRGYLPDEDLMVLSHEAAGRRINLLAPEDSLLLAKPLGAVPHEGGLRLTRSSKSYESLRDWIKEGARADTGGPKPVKLEIVPGSYVLHAPARTQQLAVLLHHADGSVRDVTPICYYNSSNPNVGDVDAGAFVQFRNPGEAAIIAHYLNLVAIVRLTYLVDVPGFKPADVPNDNLVDRAVFEKLNRMRITPSDVCTDREFIRRVYLDTIGLLPTRQEVDEFLAAPEATRRDQVINALLERPEFNDFWALKFADILRSNGRLIQPKGAYVFHRWIRAAIERGMPMDEFVRALLTTDGSTFSNPPANYYRISRDPQAAVESTAQLFLGVRIQCAKCHNHPFERWTQDDYYGFAAFFSQVGRKKGNQVNEEVVYSTGSGEVQQPRTGQVMKPKALGGPAFDQPNADRRVQLATWLTSEGNPFFAKSMVNRIWYHLVGRGIVEPVDDFRDSNPSTNDELLDGLAASFEKGGYNLKELIRTILQSRTYQLSARTNPLNADDSLYFSHAVTKLLPAEVLLDAISTVTGTLTAFDGLPQGSRATQIPDGKMENTFLKTFGRPARELACECERESDSNLSQALQLIGGATVNGKLHDENGAIAQLAKSGKTPEAIAEDLYQVALSRPPSDSERAAAAQHLKQSQDLRSSIEDLGWVLINSKEFLFRH